MGKVIATCTSEIKGVQKKMSIRSVLSRTMESRVTPMRANGTVRSAFFHMIGFRNSARAARRSRTARSVKIWSWKESISRRSRSGQNLNATMSCWN